MVFAEAGAAAKPARGDSFTLPIGTVRLSGNHAMTAPEIEAVVRAFTDYSPDASVATNVSSAILSGYLDRGYIHANVAVVSTAELSFSIDEGPQYLVESVTVPDHDASSGEPLGVALGDAVKVRAHEPYSKSRVGKDIEAMVDRLGDSGFCAATVDISTDVSDEKKTIAVRYVVTRREPCVIGPVEIPSFAGASKAKVLERIHIHEGDAFVFSRFQETRRDLEAIGLHVVYGTEQQTDGTTRRLAVKILLTTER